MGSGADRASLYDVVHGTSMSRAVPDRRNGGRFNDAQNRASVAVYSRDTDSPQRIDPNKVLQREREVAED